MKKECEHEWIWNKGTKVYYCHLCDSVVKKIKQTSLHKKLSILHIKD